MERGELQGKERWEGGGSLTQKRDGREGKDADADWEVGHVHRRKIWELRGAGGKVGENFVLYCSSLLISCKPALL